jgi:uncharacterized protein YjiS (DUF1127 family)
VTVVDLRVIGVPAPQGSKTRMPNGAMVEGGSAAGRAKHLAWRTAVAQFFLPRPASRKRDRWADRKPDLDKLLRCTLDGLTDAGLIRDDARVTYIAASKELADTWTGATLRVQPCAR